MNIAKTLVFSFLGMCLLPSRINAQTVDIGQPYKAVREGTIETIYHGNDRITLGIEKKQITIQTVSCQTLSETSVKTIKVDPKKGLPRYYERIGDNYYIIFSRKEKHENFDRFARKLDTKTWELSDEEIPFFTENNVRMVNKMTNPDQDKLIIVYETIRPKKENERTPHTYTFRTYNSYLQVVGEKTVTMPYVQDKMSFNKFIMNSAGEYVTTVVVYDDYPKKDRKVLHYELFRVRANGNEVEVNTLELPDKLHGAQKQFVHYKDAIICAGYCNPKGGSKVTATFVAKFTPGGNLISEAIQELPVWDLKMLYGGYTEKDKQRLTRWDEKKEENELSLTELRLDDVEVSDDGSVLITGQDYYYTVTRSQNGGSYTTYYYNDIYTCKISPTGKLAWVKKLPKAQINTGGYQSMSGKGKHYYIFTDSELNKDLPEDKRAVVPRFEDTWLTVTTVDDVTGELRKQYLVDFFNKDGLRMHHFSPGDVHQISENEFVFEVYKKDKEWIMIRVKL